MEASACGLGDQRLDQGLRSSEQIFDVPLAEEIPRGRFATVPGALGQREAGSVRRRGRQTMEVMNTQDGLLRRRVRHECRTGDEETQRPCRSRHQWTFARTTTTRLRSVPSTRLRWRTVH